MLNDKLRQYPFLRLLWPLAVGIAIGDKVPYLLPGWFAGAGALFLALLIACHCKNHGSLYGASIFTGLLCLGHQLASREWQRTDYPFPGKAAVYKVRIQEKPEAKAHSILCRSVILEEQRDDTLLAVPRLYTFLLYFPRDSAAAKLGRGDELWIHARLAPPSNHGNPDEFDYARYLRRKGGSGTAYVPAGEWQVTGRYGKRALRQTALDCREKVTGLYRRLGFGGDELAVLSALTVGDKDRLDEDLVETYSVSGASHVLALSGLHIGFLYALFWLVFRLLWWRWPLLKPVLLSVIVLGLWGFAFMTGLSSSVVRSATMFSLLALSTLQPEKPLTLNTLAAAAFLMLFCKPLWLFDVGFQLSFLAVTAILLIQPRLYALWQPKHCFLRYAWGLATVSVAAQLGTAPLVLLYFSRFPTHFLLTNLWAIPMVSLIMYAAVALLALSPLPVAQQALAPVVEGLVKMQNGVLRWIEHLPGSSIGPVWMGTGQAALSYLFLGMACLWVARPCGRNACLSLMAFLAGLVWHAASVCLDTPNPGLAFYNVRGCPAVHCIGSGKRSWLVCADSLPDTDLVTRALSSHWNRLRLAAPRVIGGEGHEGRVTLKDGIATYGNKRVCFLRDRRWEGKTSGQPLPIDYLYVCKDYTGNMRELSALFSIGRVIAEPGIPEYRLERIADECARQGIPCHDLAKKGTYISGLH